MFRSVSGAHLLERFEIDRGRLVSSKRGPLVSRGGLQYQKRHSVSGAHLLEQF